MAGERREQGKVRARYLASRDALKSDNYREKLLLAFVHPHFLSRLPSHRPPPPPPFPSPPHLHRPYSRRFCPFRFPLQIFVKVQHAASLLVVRARAVQLLRLVRRGLFHLLQLCSLPPRSVLSTNLINKVVYLSKWILYSSVSPWPRPEESASSCYSTLPLESSVARLKEQRNRLGIVSPETDDLTFDPRDASWQTCQPVFANPFFKRVSSSSHSLSLSLSLTLSLVLSLPQLRR